MKYLLILICLIASVSASARKAMSYRIVSDSLDTSVKAGTCIIKGTVYSDKKGLGEISTINHKKMARTQIDNTYELVVSDKDSAIYFYALGYREIVIYNYDFKSQHVVTIDFYPTRNNHNNLQRKPVIYLYPTKEENVQLTVQNKGELTFTYPEYNGSWKVTAQPDGQIKVGDKTYPYLFWEGTRDDMKYKTSHNGIEGFIISTDTTIAFLENQLSKIGLNHRESADFITYWGPIIQQKDFAFMQFILDDDYDASIANLAVSPAPESSKRVFLFLSGLDDYSVPFDVVPQTFKPFKRNGFTLIEWGGATLQLSNTIN